MQGCACNAVTPSPVTRVRRATGLHHTATSAPVPPKAGVHALARGHAARGESYSEGVPSASTGLHGFRPLAAVAVAKTPQSVRRGEERQLVSGTLKNRPEKARRDGNRRAGPIVVARDERGVWDEAGAHEGAAAEIRANEGPKSGHDNSSVSPRLKSTRPVAC